MEPVSREAPLTERKEKTTSFSPRHPPTTISFRNTHLIKHFSSLVIILRVSLLASWIKTQDASRFSKQASFIIITPIHRGSPSRSEEDTKSRKQPLLEARRRRRRRATLNSRRPRLFPPITSWFRGTVHPHARLNSQKAGEDSLSLSLLLPETRKNESPRPRGGLTFTGGWPERASRRGGVLEGLYWINSIHQIALALCRITPELSSNPRAVSVAAAVSLWQNGAKDEVLAGDWNSWPVCLVRRGWDSDYARDAHPFFP